MTTTLISSIKPAGGGDFTSLQAWLTVHKYDLVSADVIEVAECYGGGNSGTGAVLQFNNGIVSDATHYYEIRAAAGQGHDGIWDTDKAYVENTTGVAIKCGQSSADVYCDLHVTGMQVSGAGTGSGDATGTISEMTTVNVPDHGIIVDRCIVKNTGAGWAYCVHSQRVATAIHSKVTNCILISLNANAIGVIARGGIHTVDVWNNTIIVPLSYGALYVNDGAVINSNNNYIKCAANTAYFVQSGTINKGANDATSGTESDTVALRNIAYSTDNFINVTAGSEDLHLTEASALNNVGADLSANVALDIDGGIRTVPFSIGADQILAELISGMPALFMSMW